MGRSSVSGCSSPALPAMGPSSLQMFSARFCFGCHSQWRKWSVVPTVLLPSFLLPSSKCSWLYPLSLWEPASGATKLSLVFSPFLSCSSSHLPSVPRNSVKLDTGSMSGPAGNSGYFYALCLAGTKAAGWLQAWLRHNQLLFPGAPDPTCPYTPSWMVCLVQAVHNADVWPRSKWETAVLTALLVFAHSPNW